MRVLGLPFSPRAPPPRCSSVSSPNEASPWDALTSFNTGTWRGRALVYDRSDLFSCAPPVDLSFTHTVSESGALELATATQIDSSAAPVLHGQQASASLDVDLDGSFSDEHPDGLLHADALIAAAGGDGGADDGRLVLEHSLAASDGERWRCLLVYGCDDVGGAGGGAGGGAATTAAGAPLVCSIFFTLTSPPTSS
mmetsp:Transcript_46336/g.151737  ORF Transcript_46336/g.151737 Transcript_46336/m.151737 type:complete len:196 (+) Transcript_46336:69-656(+)